MAIFDEEGSTLGTFICVWLIVCFVVSTILNPLVFLYNCKHPRTVQRVVYTTLSAIDFTFCLIAPIMVVPNALKPTDCLGRRSEERGDEELHNCSREATGMEKLYSGVTRCCSYLPTILTAVLTCTRLYHIRYPLRDTLRKEILTVLLVFCGLLTCIYVLPFFNT